MARLVYFHKSLNAQLKGFDGNPPPVETQNPLMTVDFATDGHPIFLEALLEHNVFSEILVIIESARQPGTYKIGNIDCLVISSLRPFLASLRPSDILYWRGGYHWWYKLLDSLPDHWHMYYGAGTPRGSWPHWDIILTDSHELAFTKRGKLFIPWNKPINTNLFKYTKGYPSQPYDIMTAPSKIFDIKQQYRTIDAMKAYTKRYGKHLSVIMPGAYRASTQTSRMMKMIQSEKLPVYQPGWLSREDLAPYYHKTKIMTHHASGLNDRNVLEALACGVPLLSISEGGSRYPPWVKRIRALSESPNPDHVAQAIHSLLQDLPSREGIANAYLEHNSIEVGVKNLSRLIPLLEKHSPGERQKVIKEYLH
jgi:glycosyltransferase involved in cell wall biosynthesis